jgi:cytidine deaminase
LEANPKPEIVIGLVGAVGTDLKSATLSIRNTLDEFGYSVMDIKLSSLMHGVAGGDSLEDELSSEAKRISVHMDAGDSIREQTKRNDAMALLAIASVAEYRRASGGAEAAGTAFVLDSLKHPEEVRTLRRVYRDRFLLLSVHSPTGIRLARLETKIARSVGRPQDSSAFAEEAISLMKRDEWDERKVWGQQVRDTFTEADAYVSTHPTGALERGIRRFLRLYFGDPFITPTRDEYAMFHAHAAALRSADLSRQVGASVATQDGDVVAVGCNEVPKAGGGQYWEGDASDKRDFQLGYDSNAKAREDALNEAAATLSEHFEISIHGEEMASALAGTRLSNITEFGRPVHAEMSAILDAARRGVTPLGCFLFSTTYPCHNCARHIIGAGIKEVIYREPYDKSLATDLHDDEICGDPTEEVHGQVVVRRYVGVRPPRYFDLFTAGVRKDGSGNKVDWVPSDATPKLVSTEAYRGNESDLLDDVKSNLESIDLTGGEREA